MLNFVRNEQGRAEAMLGKHDDVIMAASVGYSVLQERGKQLVSDNNEESAPTMMSVIFGEGDDVVW